MTEALTLIGQSFVTVYFGYGFPQMISATLALGMSIGVLRNQGATGFRVSLSVITPLLVCLILTNVLRIYGVSATTTIGSSAYNGSTSMLMITGAYVVGLFIGHIILSHARHQVQNKSKEV